MTSMAAHGYGQRSQRRGLTVVRSAETGSDGLSDAERARSARRYANGAARPLSFAEGAAITAWRKRKRAG